MYILFIAPVIIQNDLHSRHIILAPPCKTLKVSHICIYDEIIVSSYHHIMDTGNIELTHLESIAYEICQHPVAGADACLTGK